jgi:hypothetical protein
MGSGGFGVDISVSPSFTEDTFLSRDGRLVETSTEAAPVDPLFFDRGEAVSAALRNDLQGVTVTNSIGSPDSATFELRLPMRPVFGKRNWADVLRPYTVVSIAIHRGGVRSDPAATSAPEPVMLGLVDFAEVVEDYSQQAPYRFVRVVGRSLGALLADQPWWFHRYLVAAGGEGDAPGAARIPDDFRSWYSDHASFSLLRDEVNLRTLGFLAVDPNLFLDVAERDPATCMQRAYDFFVGNAQRAGFIKMAFADGRPLRDRLVFDADLTRQSFFDQGARLMRQVLPASFPTASCWDILDLFCEPPFTELFADTFGTSVQDAAVHIIARKPPWAGHVVDTPRGPRVAFSTGSAPPGPGVGQSLFDRSLAEAVPGHWDRSLDTVTIDGADVIQRPQLRRGIDGPGAVFNAFEILPQVSSLAGNGPGDRAIQEMTPPLIDEDPASPSYVRRFGIRRFPRRASKYISTTTRDGSMRFGQARDQSMAYQLLLRTWFYRLPEFWHGRYVLRGRTALRVGRRLVDRALSREYYITSVTHRVDLAGQEPGFESACTVSRGWDLNSEAV